VAKTKKQLSILELFFALYMYVTDKKWRAKAKKIPTTAKGIKAMHAKQGQQENTAHETVITSVLKMSVCISNVDSRNERV
jgi:hypothetical protein